MITETAIKRELINSIREQQEDAQDFDDLFEFLYTAGLDGLMDEDSMSSVVGVRKFFSNGGGGFDVEVYETQEIKRIVIKGLDFDRELEGVMPDECFIDYDKGNRGIVVDPCAQILLNYVYNNRARRVFDNVVKRYLNTGFLGLKKKKSAMVLLGELFKRAEGQDTVTCDIVPKKQFDEFYDFVVDLENGKFQN